MPTKAKNVRVHTHTYAGVTRTVGLIGLEKIALPPGAASVTHTSCNIVVYI